MRIYKVIGNVTLSRCHPSYEGAPLRLAEPQGHATFGKEAPSNPDLLVIWDERSAGNGNLVAVSDGAEAAQAFRPELKPVDAYCSAILDQIHVDPKVVDQLKLKD
ncbi:MAG: EutN/CcmL family microcompartment protein [Planctomycetota bacterium]